MKARPGPTDWTTYSLLCQESSHIFSIPCQDETDTFHGILALKLCPSTPTQLNDHEKMLHIPKAQDGSIFWSSFCFLRHSTCRHALTHLDSEISYFQFSVRSIWQTWKVGGWLEPAVFFCFRSPQPHSWHLPDETSVKKITCPFLRTKKEKKTGLVRGGDRLIPAVGWLLTTDAAIT